MGLHIGADRPVLAGDGAAQQLQALAGGGGVGLVGQGDLGDAGGGDLVRQQVPAVGDGGEDAQLPAGVLALHVGGGVLLGVAVGLGTREGLGKGNMVLDHAGEDIVGGAVQNAADLQDLIGGHALAQGPQDGDAPAHAGLKEIDGVVLGGQVQQTAAVGGHQFFVGGDHALALLQGPLGEVQRSAHAADGLHDHVDLRVMLDDGEVLHKMLRKGAVGEVPHVQDILDFNELVGFFLDAGAVAGEDLRHTGADHAEAQDRYFDHNDSSIPF